MRQQAASEGTAFAQRGGDRNPMYDKKYWVNMQCFRCLQKVRPSSHCTKTITNTKSDKKIDDEESKSSKPISTTNTSKADSITKLRNSQIKMEKSFTTLNTRIEYMENEDSDFTNSDNDEEEKSHFHIFNSGIQGCK